ncbi:MAG: serine/threonine-protein kinase, partial [Planctomycetia bacterium]|nr:serine/threonine-protein kinase [Planctomycetia bacterium]
MAIKDSSTVMKILEKSRLLQLKDLEEARTISEQHPDSQEFLKILFRKKLVTRWQAGQLLAGNASFFLGKYKLIELLGAGGMGRVFRAEHITMNRSVALKIIAKDLVTDPEAQARFLNEARAIAALNHPNIVHAYSVDKEGDRYYIVMEYVEGQDLDKFIEKNGTMPQDRVARYMHQAASALQHAHERNMIHCDIKPANLLLNEETDQVKILDMGLARFHSHTDSKASANSDANANVIGTVDYMAPEVADDNANASPQSDIYSLGCVMYFLLTGNIPFPGDTMPERILKHQNEDPVHPHEVNAELSQMLGDICMKMMARPLDERYVTASDVVEALTQWLSTSSHNDPSGESSISLDFSQFISSGSSASGFSSGSGTTSGSSVGSASKSSNIRKSGLFGKFTKGGKSGKDAKDSKISALSAVKKASELTEASGLTNAGKSGTGKSSVGKSGISIDFNTLSGSSNDLHDSALRVENGVNDADDTVVASVEELSGAPSEKKSESPWSTENSGMIGKIGNSESTEADAPHPKMVQAVLLDDDDDDDDEEVFTLHVATPKPTVSTKKTGGNIPSLNLDSESAEKSRVSKKVTAKSKKSATDKNTTEKGTGKLQPALNTVKTGVGNGLMKTKNFWSNASGKQKIICVSAAGGVLLLLLVLVLVLTLTGGDGDQKVAQKPAENTQETIVEEVVEDVTEEVTDEIAEDAKNADKDAEKNAENAEKDATAEDGNTETGENAEKVENPDVDAKTDVEKVENGENPATENAEKISQNSHNTQNTKYTD